MFHCAVEMRPADMPTTTPDSCAPHHIVVIGGMNMDITAASANVLLAADSNPGRIHCAPGGVGRNVAENLARFGHVVDLVSAVGSDAFGTRLLEATGRVGVCTRWVATLPGQRTASYLSVHGPDGDMAVAVNDMDILEQLSPELLMLRVADVKGAACVVLDANLRQDSLQWLLDSVRPQWAFVDAVSVAKCSRLAPCLAGIHTLKVNRMEAKALTGLPADTPGAAQHAAQALHNAGVRHVVVSMGAEGVAWCDETGNTAYRKARTVAVASTSGAGDALLAGLVHGHLAGWTLDEAIPFAMQCAEMTLSSPFANHPLLSVEAVQHEQNS